MFNKDSQLVKTWVRLVKEGVYMKEQVPRLGNLQEVVWSILEE